MLVFRGGEAQEHEVLRRAPFVDRHDNAAASAGEPADALHRPPERHVAVESAIDSQDGVARRRNTLAQRFVLQLRFARMRQAPSLTQPVWAMNCHVASFGICYSVS